jgi:hypothetical protein
MEQGMTWPLDHPLALGGYFLLLGLVLAGFSAFHLRRAIRSRHWPSTEGRVTEARLEEDSDGQFSVAVSYRYQVDGQTHRGSEDVKHWRPTRESAQMIARKFPPGEPLVVFYDPEKPSVAVLRPGRTAGPVMLLLLSCAIGGVGLFFMAPHLGLW